jgi:hypothetical protein
MGLLPARIQGRRPDRYGPRSRRNGGLPQDVCASVEAEESRERVERKLDEVDGGAEQGEEVEGCVSSFSALVLQSVRSRIAADSEVLYFDLLVM